MRSDTRQALTNRLAVVPYSFGAVAKAVIGVNDTLKPNQVILKGQSLKSANGQYVLTLQSDGNLVMYRGRAAVFATNTVGKPATRAVMQNDGNFVLYAGKTPLWATGTQGRPGSYLVVQNDGNLTVYDLGKSWLWSSNNGLAHHGGIFGSIGDFVNTAVNATGKEIGKGLNTVAGGLHGLQNAIAHIPVIGGALATLYDLATAPFTTAIYTATAVANGESLGQGLKDQLDRLGREVSDVLPWVASIISIFPVFGPLASSIIMTAAALIKGEPIDEVLITAALSLIPGMAVFAQFAAPIIHFGIQLAKAIASGALDFAAIIVEGLDAIAGIIHITIPDIIRQALICGIHITAHLARGMKIADTLLQEGLVLLQKYGPQLLGSAYHALGLDAIVKTIGDAAASAATKLAAHIKIAGALTNINFPDFPKPLNDLMRKVFGGSVSLGAASHLQQGLADKLKDAVVGIANKGKELIETEAAKAADQLKSLVAHAPAIAISAAENLILSTAKKALPPECQHGFDVAMGVITHQVNPFQLITIRNSLDANGKKGFDAANTLHIGRVATKAGPVPKGMSPANIAAHRVGFAMTQGAAPLPPHLRKHIMTVVASHPAMKAGAVAAVTQIAVKLHEPWYIAWLKALGLYHAHTAKAVLAGAH